MDRPDTQEEEEDTAESATGHSGDPVQNAVGLAQAGLALLGDAADLLAVELELAARSLALLIALSLLLAALGVFIWVLLLAALGAFLKTGPDLSWLSMFMVLALVNTVVGIIVWQFMSRLARRLGLPGFRASMRKAEHNPSAREHDT